LISKASELLKDKIGIIKFGNKAWPVKYFDEKFDKKFINIICNTSGNTATPNAMLMAGSWMEKVNAKEKIVICITDGEANIGLDGGIFSCRAIQETKELVNQLRRKGIKVIGIGVKRNANKMQECFKEYIDLGDINELPELLVKFYLKNIKAEN